MSGIGYARGLVLLTRANEAKDLLRKYDVLEREENQRILTQIHIWYDTIAKSAADYVSYYYAAAPDLTEHNIAQLTDRLDDLFLNLKQAHKNLRFVPAPPPSESVRYVVDSVAQGLREEWQVEGTAFKGLPEVNFEEYMLIPPDFPAHVKAPKESYTPTVLSLANFYLDDPLMWPLLLHEYGHALFSQLERDPKFSAIVIQGIKDWDTAHGKQAVGRRMQAEIFADLFGLFAYGAPFLLSFATHIVIPRSESEMMDTWKGSSVSIHPAPWLRIAYLEAALPHTVFAEDPLCKETVRVLRARMHACEKRKDDIPQSLRDFVSTNAEAFGAFLRAATWKQPKTDIVSELVLRLKSRQPIATRVVQGKELATLLAQEDVKVEEPLDPYVILYAGWKYVLEDLLEGSLKSFESGKPFLDLNEGSTLRDRVDRFAQEHKRVLENLRFSLETSLIVGRMDP